MSTFAFALMNVAVCREEVERVSFHQQLGAPPTPSTDPGTSLIIFGVESPLDSRPTHSLVITDGPAW